MLLNVCQFYQALILLTLFIVANDFDLVNDKTSEQEIYRSLFVSFDMSQYLDARMFSVAEESGSDEDFMVDDDDDSDYGHSKKKGKKIVPKGGRRVEKKDKKSPKPRLKATGNHCRSRF